MPCSDIYNMKRSTNNDIVKVEPKIIFERSGNHIYKRHFSKPGVAAYLTPSTYTPLKTIVNSIVHIHRLDCRDDTTEHQLLIPKRH